MSTYRPGKKPKKWADWPEPAHHEMRFVGGRRFPVIRCRLESFQRECDLFTFWCSYCGVEHTHGAGSGHRQAHCKNPASPYRKGGYILVGPGDGLTSV